MKKVIFIFTVVFIFYFYKNIAYAESNIIKVEQKGKKFISKDKEIREINAKKNDTIEFINSEEGISHNLYSKSKGNDFMFKVQQPKESNKFKINTEGDILVKCAIHPNMKLLIHVK